jgi:hypothetical protein
MLKNKKAQEDALITEQIIFIVLNLVFFAVLIFFVMRSGSGAIVAEEAYAKKIALILDSLQPGMEVNISIKGLYDVMEKNNFKGFPISIESNKVKVTTTTKTGYSFMFFSSLNPTISINNIDKNKIMTIKT